MKTVLKKLNSRSGASMLMALLLLLIVAMVSSVIVSAASTSVFNLAAAQAQQQAYLTVASPAKLMRETAQQGLWSYKTVVTKTQRSWDNQETWQDYTENPPVTTQPGENVFFGPYIAEAIEQVLVYKNNPYAESYTISVPGYDDVAVDLLFAPISGDEIQRDSYRLRITFSVPSNVEGNSEAASPFRLTLTMDAEVEESTNNGTAVLKGGTRNVYYERTASVTRELKWNATTAKIEKGEGGTTS